MLNLYCFIQQRCRPQHHQAVKLTAANLPAIASNLRSYSTPKAEEPAEALGRASELGADEAKVSGWVPF